jgi:tmRNA-binding protein
MSSPSNGSSSNLFVNAINFVEEKLNLELTPAIAKHIGQEIFLYSCKIVKYNQYGWRNERTLVMTQESLMLLKKKCKDLRRKVAISSLMGLTLSYHHESHEMIIHIIREPDIRLVSPGHRK